MERYRQGMKTFHSNVMDLGQGETQRDNEVDSSEFWYRCIYENVHLDLME